ncbi:MAG: carboxypeptidase-like regulatory domain-containing protein, partial [Nonlabens sp.]
MKNFLLSIALIATSFIYAQNAVIQGVILDDKNQPIAEANINVIGTTIGTASDRTGFYRLVVPANQKITIVFSSISFKPARQEFELDAKATFEFNPVLNTAIEQIGTVTINNTRTKEFAGITNVDPTVVRAIPGVQPGVENLLKSLPGVSSNNELSTQYAVRGGNYDENLVYINEIEVYRPFLVRSGQQEGLSIVNADLVRSVDFSAGGFQSKYGDKLSSVLDINSRRPTEFGAGIDASFLGVNAYVEGTAFAKA